MSLAFAISTEFRAIDKFSEPVHGMQASVDALAKMGGRSLGRLESDIYGVGQAVSGVGLEADIAAGRTSRVGSSLQGVAKRARRARSGLDDALTGLRQLKDPTTDITGLLGILKMSFVALGAAGTGAAVLLKRGFDSVVDSGKEVELEIKSAAARLGVLDDPEMFEAVNQAARDIGANTEQGTAQAAGALKFLGKAGEDPLVAIKTLGDFTDFAAANEMELARATDIASDSLGMFGLATDDTGQKVENYRTLLDKMTVGAGNANMDLEMLFEASKSGAGAFLDGGQSIDTFIASVQVLADEGVKGGKAGNDLGRVMRRLVNPVGRGADALKKLGVRVSDAEGDIRDFPDLIDDINKKVSGLDETKRFRLIADLAGEEGVEAFSKLLRRGGDTIREYSSELDDATGANKRLAEAFRDTAQGRSLQFDSMMEGFKLDAFDIFKDDLKSFMELVLKFGSDNRELIGDSVKAGIIFFKENLPTVLDLGGKLGTVVDAGLGFARTFLDMANDMLPVVEAARLVSDRFDQLSATWGFAKSAIEAVVKWTTPMGFALDRVSTGALAAKQAWDSWSFTGWLSEAFPVSDWIEGVLDKLPMLRDMVELVTKASSAIKEGVFDFTIGSLSEPGDQIKTGGVSGAVESALRPDPPLALEEVTEGPSIFDRWSQALAQVSDEAEGLIRQQGASASASEIIPTPGLVEFDYQALGAAVRDAMQKAEKNTVEITVRDGTGTAEATGGTLQGSVRVVRSGAV